jgi:protein-S-isoprenylcysteine O-methyltransferase Ste14
MDHEAPAYGLWSLVFINSLIFIIFAFSFTKPSKKRDWVSLGGFSAFIVALFVEMYGFPLTIYLFSGWLLQRYPNISLYSHDTGHLLHTLFGLKGNPHFDIFHILSHIFIFLGIVILGFAWGVLANAQKQHRLATTGLYARIQHPQYVGFILIMFGFLLQWPTLLTLLMFPILVIMYIKLAKMEERDMSVEFGKEYETYAAKTPRFLPNLWD